MRKGTRADALEGGRVGTGLKRSEEEEMLDRVLGDAGTSVYSERLIAGRRGTAPPCYRVTGHPDEWPEWWIASPETSVVLQVGLSSVYFRRR